MVEGQLNDQSSRPFLARVQADTTAMSPHEHDGLNRIWSIDDQGKSCMQPYSDHASDPADPEGIASAPSSPFPGPIEPGPGVR